MKYTKRGTYRTFHEYIQTKTGKSLSGLNKYLPYYALNNLDNAAARILEAVKRQEHIEIHTDFDDDGIGSAVQMLMILRKMNARNYNVTVPKRFSDGYGIQPRHVDNMPGGLLITIDNGITAIDAIAKAKEKGMDVIVIDHHLAGIKNKKIILPKADIMIDPETMPEGNDYTGYCAAGLINRLLNHLFPNDQNLQMQAAAVAAISTVADSVPLTDDNRQIVQRGLWSMNHDMATAGIQAVIDVMDLKGHVSSEDLAFVVGPMFNAPGRLYDQGSRASAFTMLCNDSHKAMSYAAQLKIFNETRKRLTKNAMESLYLDESLPIQFICADMIPAGLLGILAGKVAELTGKPAFIYKITGDHATGSARSDDETQNNVKAILDTVAEYLTKYGGHAGAAGFSFLKKDELALYNCLMKYPVKPHTAQYFYDLEMDPEDAQELLKLMDLAEPFGKGMERPVFRMACHFTGNNFWKPMGDGKHISFHLPGLKAVGFHMKERFAQDGYPANCVFYGDLNWNWYKGQAYPNFRIIDYELLS